MNVPPRSTSGERRAALAVCVEPTAVCCVVDGDDGGTTRFETPPPGRSTRDRLGPARCRGQRSSIRRCHPMPPRIGQLDPWRRGRDAEHRPQTQTSSRTTGEHPSPSRYQVGHRWRRPGASRWKRYTVRVATAFARGARITRSQHSLFGPACPVHPSGGGSADLRSDEHRRMHEADRCSDTVAGGSVRLLLPNLWHRTHQIQLRDVRKGLLLPLLQYPAARIPSSGRVTPIAMMRSLIALVGSPAYQGASRAMNEV